MQTGTSHGGVVLPDGTIADVKLDLEALEALVQAARTDYGLAGAVQHGACTLPSDAFGNFPGWRRAEIHLATNFQNMVFDHPALPAELRERMYAWLDANAQSETEGRRLGGAVLLQGAQEGDRSVQGGVLVAAAEDVRDAIAADLERTFGFLFDQLNVNGTAALVRQYVMRPISTSALRRVPGLRDDDPDAGRVDMSRDEEHEVVYVAGRRQRQADPAGARWSGAVGLSVRAAERRADSPDAQTARELSGTWRRRSRRALGADHRRVGQAGEGSRGEPRGCPQRSRTASGRSPHPAKGARSDGRGRGASRLTAGMLLNRLRSAGAFTRRTLTQADRHNIPFLASALTFDALLAAIPLLLLLLVGLTYRPAVAELDGAGPPSVVSATHSPRGGRRQRRALRVGGGMDARAHPGQEDRLTLRRFPSLSGFRPGCSPRSALPSRSFMTSRADPAGSILCSVTSSASCATR